MSLRGEAEAISIRKERTHRPRRVWCALTDRDCRGPQTSGDLAMTAILHVIARRSRSNLEMRWQ